MVGDWEKAASLGPVAVEPLLAMLKVGEASVRWQAARALGMIGDARAVEPLIMTALEEREFSIREAARQAQLNIGSVTVEPFVMLLGHKDWKVRQEAAERLSWLKWIPQSEEQEAAYAVVRLDWERAMKIGAAAAEPLVLALTVSEKSICESAAITLGMIGDIRAVKPLIAALKSASREASLMKIMEALGRTKSEEAIVPLIQVYREHEYSILRTSAMRALEEIGSVAAAEVLLSQLRHSTNKHDQINTVKALAKFKHSQTVGLLIGMLKGNVFKEEWSSQGLRVERRDYEVATAAAEALGELRDPRAIMPLVTVFNTEKYGGDTCRYLEGSYQSARTIA